MFFPDKIRSIQKNDRVLEVGPGSTPLVRADVLLEYRFESEEEAYNQRGRIGLAQVDSRTVFYSGNRFPFEDKQFDYVIASHVIEHVDDVDQFVSELCRVAHRGYIEFPLIHYEYLYNIPEHRSFVVFDGEIIKWIPKSQAPLDIFKPAQSVLSEALGMGYSVLIEQMPEVFIQGFEWSGMLKSKQVRSIAEVAPSRDQLKLIPLSETSWMKDHVRIRTEELRRLQAVEVSLGEYARSVENLKSAWEFRIGRRLRKLLRLRGI